MTDNIKKHLKERYELTKYFYKNSQKERVIMIKY